MKFLNRIEKIKSENKDKIVLARCGAFVVAVGSDAILLSELLGLKKTCIRKRICKVGIPVTYTLKYLQLIENKGYSFVLCDYSKDTKEMIEKYKYIGINKVEKISIDCSLCENYKEENVIDIFELLRRKEEEKIKKEMLEKDRKSEKD